MRKYLEYALTACLVIATAKISYDLWGMFVFEIKAINSDALIYLTMGRGILNGLRPYIDLFESKAIGIFYLNALSVWLTNGTALLRVLQVINFLSIPAVLVYFVRKEHWNWILSALVLGCLITLRAEEVAPGLQTEIFALLPAALYLLTLTMEMNWKRILISGLCIFCAIILREPYILGFAGAALLYSRSVKEFCFSFLYPAILAVSLVAIALLSLGLFETYTQVYLPAMALNRSQGEHIWPLILRPFWIKHLYEALTVLSTTPLIGYLLCFLWGYSVSLKIQLERKMTILTGVAAFTGAVGMHHLFVLFSLFYAVPIGPWAVLTSNFWPIALVYLVCILLYIAFISYLGWKDIRILPVLGAGFIAVLLLDLAIGIGGYQWTYTLYITPAVLVPFLMFLQKKYLFLPIGFLICAAAFLYTGDKKNPERISLNEKAIEYSKKLEVLMDSCKFNTYVFNGGLTIFAYSKYSPVGPMFTQFHEYLGLTSPLYMQTYQNMLNAPLFIEEIGNAPPVPRQVREKFTEQPPMCAKGILLPDFTLRFRK